MTSRSLKSNGTVLDDDECDDDAMKFNRLLSRWKSAPLTNCKEGDDAERLKRVISEVKEEDAVEETALLMNVAFKLIRLLLILTFPLKQLLTCGFK